MYGSQFKILPEIKKPDVWKRDRSGVYRPKGRKVKRIYSDRFQDKKPFDMDDVYTIIEKAYNILTGKER